MKLLVLIAALLVPSFVLADGVASADADSTTIHDVIIDITPHPEPAPIPPALLSPAPGPTKSDNRLHLAWDFMTDGGNAIHFLDNGTAASLYDFNRKEWLGGAMTSLYQPIIHVRGQEAKPLSFDIGVIKSLEAGNSAFPFGAVRFHGREMLEKANPDVQNFFSARTNLLKYLTCGGWVARDWNIGEYRYGGFVGAEAKLFN